MWAIIKDKKYIIYHYNRYKYINIYFFFPGLTVAFYAGFLYKLVKMSLPKNTDEDIDAYNMRINEHEGYVFIVLGVSMIFMGILMNRFADKYNTFKLATVGTLIV